MQYCLKGKSILVSISLQYVINKAISLFLKFCFRQKLKKPVAEEKSPPHIFQVHHRNEISELDEQSEVFVIVTPIQNSNFHYGKQNHGFVMDEDKRSTEPKESFETFRFKCQVPQKEFNQEDDDELEKDDGEDQDDFDI